jgi:hypothetical protein
LTSENDLREALLKMLAASDINAKSLYQEIISYATIGALSGDEAATEVTDDKLWSKLIADFGNEEADRLLHLATTTEELNFFFENLLVSSNGNLREELKTLDLEANNIRNSVDLVQYLFSLISDDTYSAEDLLQVLEKAQSSKITNLKRFQKLLASQAEGSLKLQIDELFNELDEAASFEDMLTYLLNESVHNDYSRESVYDLLVRLTGIKNVSEFAEKLMLYNNAEINKAIADTTLESFSNPLELVQYLIAATQNYNYTSSDINNLLIRMILEKGLIDDLGGDYYKEKAKPKYWKSKQFISTAILVSIAILILITLFIIRRRKSKQDEKTEQ